MTKRQNNLNRGQDALLGAAPEEDIRRRIAQARAGDRKALEALMVSVQPQVYTLAQRFLWSPSDAEDATQEILIKVMTRLSQFDGESKFSTWVFRVASNHLIDRKRSPAFQDITFDAMADDLADGLEADASYLHSQPSAARILLWQEDDYSPEQLMALNEIRVGCTLAMLQCLTAEQRLAYVLGEILELEHSIATQVLDINSASYRKRLSRARERISDFMRQHCGLTHPANNCRCHKRLPRARQLGRVKDGQLNFVSSADTAKRFPQILDEIRKLEQVQRASALYRAQTDSNAIFNMQEWLKHTVSNL